MTRDPFDFDDARVERERIRQRGETHRETMRVLAWTVPFLVMGLLAVLGFFGCCIVPLIRVGQDQARATATATATARTSTAR